MFKKECQSGISDLCYKWPCIFNRLNITVREAYSLRVSVGWDGKQRHLVYMKKASSFISRSTAAWPDPWLQSLRHIVLPTGGCPLALHGTKPAVSKLQPHNIPSVSEKSKNKLWVGCEHRWYNIVSYQFNQISLSSTFVWLHNWHIWSFKSKGILSLMARYLHSINKFSSQSFYENMVWGMHTQLLYHQSILSSQVFLSVSQTTMQLSIN